MVYLFQKWIKIFNKNQLLSIKGDGEKEIEFISNWPMSKLKGRSRGLMVIAEDYGVEGRGVQISAKEIFFHFFLSFYSLSGEFWHDLPGCF